MTAGRVAVVVVDGVRFRRAVGDGASLTLGHASDCDVHLPPALDVPPVVVGLRDGTVTLTAGDVEAHGPASATTVLDVPAGRVEARVVAASGRTVYDLRGVDELVVGVWPGASLTVADPEHAVTARRRLDGRWDVSVLGDDVFVDNVRASRGRVVLHDGDHLGLGGHDLVLLDGELHVDDGAVVGARLPRRASSDRTPPPGYPEVRRSPRLVHRPPEGALTVGAVPADGAKRSGQLAKLVVPPLVMLAVTGAMALVNGNALMVLTSAATSVVTLGFSVHGYRKDRRTQHRERAEAEETYRAHLDTRAAEVREAADAQRRGALYHHPALASLVELAAAHSPRVFEKAPQHHDFLHYRLGLGTVPASVRVQHADPDGVPDGTELDALSRELCAGADALEQMPVGADLVHGPVGYVGPRRLVVEQLQLLVNQLAFFHSYHDVQLVVVLPEQELVDWAWMRWFRHAALRDVNLRGLVHDQRSRDQVLSTLNQVLKVRRTARAEVRGGQSTTFTPHYVVLILDETLVLDHVVMEFLRGDPTDLGCSVVVVQETMSSLSDAVTTVVDIRDRDTGVLVLERGELVNRPFALDHVPDGLDLERLPRTVGALVHLQDLRSSISESVTFLEMYGVERVEELGVAARWAANSPHRTLGVPLGLRGPDDVVRLDLHEKAHGPHGLVAGTTGSGKSEIVQSYILSLAVNFHPHDVAFLLIDYKGGGMANLFADLPHLLGTITNLDGAQSMRALVSINAELKRRQRAFSEHGVNHINQYQKLVKNGDAAEPMPHLFLISDEFAELKSEQPEFMDELISTARIGRSLGIHLILATQKPSGVVNDQIWSNSKFKLALKVADRSDSMEIIKTPDAAEITLPGRAYLQVGNNEIYELFQSAWSGADYRPDREDDPTEDLAVYAINDLGQYEILTQDLSGLDGTEDLRQAPTELEAVVAEVGRAAVAGGVAALPRPWLPPLPERICVTDLHDVDPAVAWAEPKAPLRPVIGTVDIPSMQAQETLRLDLTGDGHVAVFASPGYGKSTFLQTLVMDLARTHSPEHLHVYLLDFGTNGLLPLRGLPHVADTVTLDDTQKTRKLVERIEVEIKRRKQLLSGYSVANLSMYERASGEALPHVLLVVDGVEALKGEASEEVLTTLMYGVAREGAGLGMHLALSTGRQTTLRGNVAANIKTQLALKMNDDVEPVSIVGRTTLRVDDLPGRGLVHHGQPELFQAALPTPGADMLEIVDAIRAEAAGMDARWQGARPEHIPVIPETLDLDDLLARPGTARLVAEGTVPVGLDLDSVEPTGLAVSRQRRVLVLAEDGESVGARIALLWRAGSRAFAAGAFVIDDDDGNLRALVRETRGGATTVHDTLDAAIAELDLRGQAYEAARATADPPSAAEFGRSLDRALVIVGDVSSVATQLGEQRAAGLLRLISDGPQLGMPVLLGGRLGAAGKGPGDLSQAIKDVTAGVVVGRIADQSVLRASNLPYKEPLLGPDGAWVVADGKAVPVKIPAPS
ncbi:type VII secretion protein EssC [Cellulomonas sp. NPDC058312]|uniref:type VII secretion protein EssC n=1 Tax=Cellulomonas sp. NPDC058312 TaxID=3346441 RepID=UPI0036E81510